MSRSVAILLALCGVAVAVIAFRNVHAWQAAEVTLDQSEGFADFKLPVAHRACDSRAGCVLDVTGTYHKEPIALRIVFAPGMRQIRFDNLKANGGISAKANGVVLQLRGKPGENFVRMLASAYRIPIVSISLPDTVPLTAVALEGDPQHIASVALKIKVFHRDDDPDGPYYFELYIDPDLPNGVVALNEKDMDYRKPILRSLGAVLK
jgi:hypothetical protein